MSHLRDPRPRGVPRRQPGAGGKVCAYDVDWCHWTSTQLSAAPTTDVNGAFESGSAGAAAGGRGGGGGSASGSSTRRWPTGCRLSGPRPRILLTRGPSRRSRLRRAARQTGVGRASRCRLRSAPISSAARAACRQAARRAGARTAARLAVVAVVAMAGLHARHHLPRHAKLPDARNGIVDEGYSRRAGTSRPLSTSRWSPTIRRAADRPARILAKRESASSSTRVCEWSVEDIGGNLGGHHPRLEGYLHPGPVPLNTANRHRPFGGIVPVYKNPGRFDRR